MPNNDPTGDDGDTRRTPDASQPQTSDDVAGDGNPGDENAGDDDDDTPEGRATQLNMYLSDDGEVLDLTGNQLKDLAGIPLPPTLTDLDLTTNRLAALDPRIGDLERLEKLSFRKNLITDAAAAGLKDLTRLTSLKELVLRDNLLKKVPLVSPLTALSLLDLSYNHIHAMAPLAASTLPALRELYLANNRIGHIEALEGFTQLRLLELGSNKIREMESLSHLSCLEELWVGRNKIREVRVAGLTALVKISVQSNRLTCMRGFESCTRLQELYLSNNGISVMEGLEALTTLRILDLAANAISHVQGLDTLTRLEDLWLNDNRIKSLSQLMAALEGPKASLVTLYLERNPC
ncbi:unnamed protein product, partial [Closterium sp. Naga37s-1]